LKAPSSAERPVLEVRQIERRFGGLVALTGVDLAVRRGEIFGLVGPNGSGKTTMTNAITGFYPPQKGSIRLDGRDITGMAPHAVARLGVARTFQNLALFNGMTVLDNILLGRHVHMKPGVLRTAFYPWLAQARGDRAPPCGRGDHRLHAAAGRARRARRRHPHRPEEARRAGARAGGRAQLPDPGRADGRHEPGGEGIHGALRAGRARRARRDGDADRAPHGHHHRHLRPHAGAELRRGHRHRHPEARWCRTRASSRPTWEARVAKPDARIQGPWDFSRRQHAAAAAGRQCARARRRGGAAREGPRHLAADQLGAVAGADAVLRRRARGAGICPRRRAAGGGRQPAAPVYRAAGRRHAGRLCDAGLPRRRARRGAACHPDVAGALRAGRGPGAGRQDPRPARDLPLHRARRLRRPARPGRLPGAGTGVVAAVARDGGRAAAARAGPARRAGRPRHARRPGGLHPFLRHHRSPQGRGAEPPQRALGRGQCPPRQGLRLRRGGPGLPADGLGGRLRHHAGRRRGAALHHQHPRAARDGAAQPARDRAHLLPGGTAQLGQHAHHGAGAHGGFHAAEEGALRPLHEAGHQLRARAARRPPAQRGLQRAAATHGRMAGLRSRSRTSSA
jgi:ABC-type sugar transport system ATPase subunit